MFYGWNVSWEGLYTTAQGLHELRWLRVPGEPKKTGKGASQEAYLREGSQNSLLPLGVLPNPKAEEKEPVIGKINNLHCTICDVSGWFVTFSNTVCHEQHWGNNPQKYSWLKIAPKIISKWTIKQKFCPFYKQCSTKNCFLITREVLQNGNSLKNILTGNSLTEII